MFFIFYICSFYFSVAQSESHVIQVSHTDVIYCINNSTDKITNTETSSSSEVKEPSLEEIATLTNDSKTDTKRNLSWTPICSVDTNDNQTERQIASNTIFYLRYETQKQYGSAEIGKNTIKNDDLFFSMCTRNLNKTFFKGQQYSCVTSHKLQPEVRVANFVQIMEKEIMPLKNMLSDIISKCSSYGFNWMKAQQRPILYKNVPSREKQISRCLKTKKQINCNRVVYSIVFDG